MATTLRELIAKVVFRADPSEVKEFDAGLDALKAKLVGVTSQTQDTAAKLKASAESFLGLRVSLQEVNGALDPARAEGYASAFKASEARANELRAAIDRLRLVDPQNKELPALERQLSGVEKEAKETAAALERVGVTLKGVKAPAATAATGVDQLKNVLGGLATAAVAYKAIAFGKGLIDEARAVGDLAARLAIGTDELQTWSAFTAEVGASTEDFSGTVKTLAKNIQDAAGAADGPAAKAFAKLGLSTQGWSKELPGTLDVLLAAGGALNELEGDTERLALAQQVLGEAGLKLLPAFEGGAEAAQEQLDSLRDLAVVYSEDFIAKSTAASNEAALFQRQLKGVAADILLDVLPALRDFVRWLTPVIKNVREVVGQTHLFSAAVGVGGVAAVAKLVTKFGGLNNALKAGGKMLLKFILPLLILDDIIGFLKGDGSLIGDVLDGIFGAGAQDTTRETILGIFEGFKLLVQFLKGDVSADEFFDKFIKGTQPVQDAIDRMVAYIKTKIDELVQYVDQKIRKIPENILRGTIGDGATDWLGQHRREETDRDPVEQGVRDLFSWLDTKLGGGWGWADAAQPPTATLSPSSRTSTVTINDSSSITTNLNGVDGKNVGSALRQSERNVTTSLERSRAQVLRQTVGAQ
jgi:hypothetical protein